VENEKKLNKKKDKRYKEIRMWNQGTVVGLGRGGVESNGDGILFKKCDR